MAALCKPAAPAPAAPHLTPADFDFDLPPELIAQRPAAERSGARLLDARGEALVDRRFSELTALLDPRDLLVFNDTRVIKARLHGHKASGGAVEVLVERVLPDGAEVWAHVRASKAARAGSTLRLAGAFDALVLGRCGPQAALFHLRFPADAMALLDRHGAVPLPPYIAQGARGDDRKDDDRGDDNADDNDGGSNRGSNRSNHDDRDDRDDRDDDERRYQTVFARVPGAVAAPTAALHFDRALLDAIAARGIASASITLHVGAGTFLPVRTATIAAHRMHSEWFDVPQATVDAVARTRAAGGRVVAVGTTTLRALESAAAVSDVSDMSNNAGALTAGARETDIFITPGFDFQVVDALVTNFHLPRSTLLMLVSAFAGRECIRALYAHAVRERYRFFSYGDAMLLLRRR